VGASALKGWRLRDVAPEARAGLAVGGASAFASTLLSARLLRAGERGKRALWPYALYRCALAGMVATRVRGSH
jgi:hypothetical protein